MVFEMVFINCYNITDKVYRGWAGGRGVGGGWEVEGGQYHPQ